MRLFKDAPPVLERPPSTVGKEQAKPPAPKPAAPKIPLGKQFDLFMAGSVKPQSVSQMLHSFSLLIRSGIPISRTMEILAEQETHEGLRDVLLQIGRIIGTQGLSIAAAVKQFPKVFSPPTQLLIRAGDISGDLASRVEQAAQMIDRETKLSNEIKGAITTPIMTAVACILMTWGVVHFVMPKFLEMYVSMKIELPLITKLVVLLVEVVNNPLTTFGALGLLVLAFMQRDRVWEWLSKAAFALPMSRRFIGQMLATSFCDVLGRLYADGVAISISLDMLASTTNLGEYRRVLEKVSARFKNDGQLSEALKMLTFFPSTVVNMVSVGEESGQLDRMLLTLHDLLDEANQDVLHRAVVMLEPLMMGVVGLILSFLAVGLFLPIYQMLSHLGM